MLLKHLTHHHFKVSYKEYMYMVLLINDGIYKITIY